VGTPTAAESRRALLLGALAAILVVAAAACAPAKKGPPGPRVMLVGDSIAHSMQGHLAFAVGARGWGFEPSAQQGCSVVRGVITDFVGGPLPSAHPCDQAMWGVHQEKVDRFRPSVVVWLDFFEVFPRLVDGGYFTPGTVGGPAGSTTGAAADAKILQLIEEKRVQFTAHGAKLVFVTVPPPPPGEDTLDMHRLRIPHLNGLLRTFVIEHPGTTALIDLAALACPPNGQACPPSNLRTDGFHFSGTGAKFAAEQIVARL
jgi:SGNH domain (fused to AT3 domains)